MNTINPIYVNYIKLLVIELDPFCESGIVVDLNCKPTELADLKSNLHKEYPDDKLFMIIEKPMSITLG